MVVVESCLMANALNRIDRLLSQLDNVLESKTSDDDFALIDHIVYFVKDLESSIEKFTKLLGVRPIIGGRHLKWGSWNALFSLSNGTYFELLADDPNSKVKHQGFLKQLASNKADGEGIITFMYRPPKQYNKNLEKYKSIIKEKTNYNAGNIFGGERALENGQILKWDLMAPSNDDDTKGVTGICIDWQLQNFDELHPSNTSPKGVELLQLTIYHPNYENLKGILYDGINIERGRFVFKYGKSVKWELKVLSKTGSIVTL